VESGATHLILGDYNPYSLNVSGGWLNYGPRHHRGDVYLDEEAFEPSDVGAQNERDAGTGEALA
jgi:hypothetical protein